MIGRIFKITNLDNYYFCALAPNTMPHITIGDSS